MMWRSPCTEHMSNAEALEKIERNIFNIGKRVGISKVYNEEWKGWNI